MKELAENTHVLLCYSTAIAQQFNKGFKPFYPYVVSSSSTKR